MVFIRKKSIKGHEYAYLVENVWKKRPKKGCRQKVKSFLGRVHIPKLKANKDFLEYNNIKDIESYVKENSFRKIIKELVMFELFMRGASDFSVDFDKLIVSKKGRNAVIQMNEGFLCSHTLKNLANFKLKHGEEAGYSFAKVFVEAGIKIPEELFIKIFEKLS